MTVCCQQPSSIILATCSHLAYDEFMPHKELSVQEIVDRINHALPALIPALNASESMAWFTGVSRDQLEVSRVPVSFITGENYSVACAAMSRTVPIGAPLTAKHINSRLLVVDTIDDDEWMLAELAYHNEENQTLGLASFEFNDVGEIGIIHHTGVYQLGTPLTRGGAYYMEACVTSLMLRSADNNEPASGISHSVVDGVKVYQYKYGLDSDLEHNYQPIQVSPRSLPRLRNELAKEMRGYAGRTPFKLSKSNMDYFNEIGNELGKSTEMWWVSEDMAKLAWDVAISGTEPEDLDEREAPAKSGIMWLNGGGGPALLTKYLPDESFMETGQTATETLSINAIMWYTPTVGIPGLEVGKTRFMALTASPALTRDTAQWNSMISPLDLESNEIEYSRIPTYVTVNQLKFLPRKLALIVMRLSREETVSERTQESVIVDGSGKKRKQNRKIETVTCASLRRHRYTSEAEREAEAREYSHRWIVRGHMRNQPIGPRHAEGGQKYERVWIAPYVKGPEDKPLVLKDRVQVWRR